MKRKGTTISSLNNTTSNYRPITITLDSMDGDVTIIEALFENFNFISKSNFFNLSGNHYFFVRKYLLLWVSLFDTLRILSLLQRFSLLCF